MAARVMALNTAGNRRSHLEWTRADDYARARLDQVVI